MLLKILIFIFITIIYILCINLIFISLENNLKTTNSGGIILDNNAGDIQVGIGDDINVIVDRQRFYGSYIENVGRDSKSIVLYLFNIIKLPMRLNKINFFMIHMIYLITSIALISFYDIEEVFNNWI